MNVTVLLLNLQKLYLLRCLAHVFDLLKKGMTSRLLNPSSVRFRKSFFLFLIKTHVTCENKALSTFSSWAEVRLIHVLMANAVILVRTTSI